jgi:hypothetical protein
MLFGQADMCLALRAVISLPLYSAPEIFTEVESRLLDVPLATIVAIYID